jgi:hypothetical protein
LRFAATSCVPWATLLARTFEIDAKACAHCGGRLEVRAVVTDHDIARRILDAIPTAARAPPSADSTVAFEPVRVTDREPMVSSVLRDPCAPNFSPRPTSRTRSHRPDGIRPSAFLPHLASTSYARLVSRTENDLGSEIEKLLHDRAADTLRPAGHERTLTVEAPGVRFRGHGRELTAPYVGLPSNFTDGTRSGSVTSMPEALVLSPTADPRVFVAPDGRKVSPPADWACLPPGDAMITRRVKQAGPSWAIVEKKGRKVFSKGVWAPRATIEQVKAGANAERSTEAYAKKRSADVERRAKTEAAYAESFETRSPGISAFHTSGRSSAK